MTVWRYIQLVFFIGNLNFTVCYLSQLAKEN